MAERKKYKRINNDLQNIHIKLYNRQIALSRSFLHYPSHSYLLSILYTLDNCIVYFYFIIVINYFPRN